MSKPKYPQKLPYLLKGENQKYAWCACGESANQPFCDGSHKGTELTPIIVDNNKEGNIAWCGCKCSKTKSYCDGTHLSCN